MERSVLSTQERIADSRYKEGSNQRLCVQMPEFSYEMLKSDVIYSIL